MVSLSQAICGSGKLLKDVPKIQANMLPLPGEAEKSQKEPQKIFGKIVGDKIVAEGLTKVRPGMKVKPIIKSQ